MSEWTRFCSSGTSFATAMESAFMLRLCLGSIACPFCGASDNHGVQPPGGQYTKRGPAKPPIREGYIDKNHAGEENSYKNNRPQDCTAEIPPQNRLAFGAWPRCQRVVSPFEVT